MNQTKEIENMITINNILQQIYDATYHLKFNTHENTVYGRPFNKTTIQSIQNKEYFGWNNQICFLLTPLYEKAILNRGTLFFEGSNEIGDFSCYSWIEIFCNNKWYSFDPCFNRVYEKDVFDKLYRTKVICSFTSDEIRSKLIYNLFFPDEIPNNGYKDIIKNQIYQLSSNKGIILPADNVEELTYGAAFTYTLKKSHNKIKSLKAEYIGYTRNLPSYYAGLNRG